MSQVKVQFSGKVVAEPEHRNAGGADLLEFPVYVNHTKRVPNSQPAVYEPTGETTKIRVTLWRDLADEDIRKGDIVEVDGTLIEKSWEKQDGTTGRSLQTDFVNSIVVKWRADAEATAGTPAGF